MAAIVAQITKANWERKQNRKYYVNTEKSTYFIPPFDEHFDPVKHNVYMKRKAAYEKQHAREEAIKNLKKEAAERVKAIEAEREKNEPLATKWMKAFLGAGILALPMALLIFLFITFYYLDTPE